MHALIARLVLWAALAAATSCQVADEAQPTTGRPEGGTRTGVEPAPAPTGSGKDKEQETITVKPGADLVATAERLEISPAVSDVPIGIPLDFRVLALFTNGSRALVTDKTSWRVSPAGILQAGTSPGSYVAVGIGSATVTAEAEGQSVVATVNVRDVELQTVRFQPRVLIAGTAQKVYATGFYSDGTTQDLTSIVTWSITDPTVAAPDEDDPGRVRGLKFGTTTITAQFSGKAYIGELEVRLKKITSLAVEAANPFVIKGNTLRLIAKATFVDNSQDDVSSAVQWTANDTSVATINNTNDKGLVAGVELGSTTIKATIDEHQVTYGLSVVLADFDSITFEPSNPTLPLGAPQKLVALGWKGPVSTDISSLVTWSVNNPNLATISNTAELAGTVTPLAAGLVTIKAKLGVLEGLTLGQVIAPVVKEIILDAPAGAPYACGQGTQQIAATGVLTDNTTVPLTDVVTWQSVDPSIATVSAAPGTKGKVTSIKPGTVGINAAYYVAQTGETINKSITLEFGPPVFTQLVVDTDTPSVPVGLALAFSAEKHFSCGVPTIVTSQATWQSDNPTILDVSNDAGAKGQALTAGAVVSNQTVTVGATFDGSTASKTVTVRPREVVALSLQGPNPPHVAIGYTEQLGAFGLYSDGDIVDFTSDVAWESLSPAVATVDNVGTKGLVTGVVHGQVSIRATYSAPYGDVTKDFVFDAVSYCPETPTRKLYQRHCWTLGAPAVDCHAACGGAGSYDNFMEAFLTHPEGTSRCGQLTSRLRNVGISFPNYTATAGEPGLGCTVLEAAGGLGFGMHYVDPVISPTAAAPSYRRVCSCFH